jgi:hypothetical protein
MIELISGFHVTANGLKEFTLKSIGIFRLLGHLNLSIARVLLETIALLDRSYKTR